MKIITELNQKQIILLGCVCAFLLGSIYVGFHFIRDTFDNNAIAAKELKLQKLRKIILKKNQIKRQTNEMNTVLAAAENGLLNGKTTSLAAVDLQNVMNDLATRNNSKIRTMTVLKTTQPKDGNFLPYPRVSIRISLDVDIDQLDKILYGLATSPKMLQVDILDILLARNPKTQVFSMSITVTGIMKDSTPNSNAGDA